MHVRELPTGTVTLFFTDIAGALAGYDPGIAGVEQRLENAFA